MKRDTLNQKRASYIDKLCQILGYDFKQITNLDCYNSKNGYVNSPSNYPKQILAKGQAANLRALFNMRQDLLIVTECSMNFFETKIESENNKEQIELFCLLKKLLDKDGWAGIEQFRGIKEVNLFYIKRTKKPLRIDLPANSLKPIITWAEVFEIIQGEISTFHGIGIGPILKNIKF
jgi:hypothetical protein